MSNAWEVTIEDVRTVLAPHKHPAAGDHKLADAIYEEFIAPEVDRIEIAALEFITLENQTDSAYEEIEKILIEEGVITDPKHWTMPDHIVDEIEDEEDDWDDEEWEDEEYEDTDD